MADILRYSFGDQLNYGHENDPIVKRLLALRGSPNKFCADLYKCAKRGNWPRHQVLSYLKTVDCLLTSRSAFNPGTPAYRHRVWHETGADPGPGIKIAGESAATEVLAFRNPYTSLQSARVSDAPGSKETIVDRTRNESADVIHPFAGRREGHTGKLSAQLELDKTDRYFYGPFAFDRRQSPEQQQWKAPYQQIVRNVSLEQYFGEEHGDPKYRRLIVEARRRVEAAGNSKGAGKTLPADDYVAHALSTELHADMIFMREVHAILLEDGWEDRYLDRAG